MLATVLFILSLLVGGGLVWFNFAASIGYVILTVGGIVFGPIALIGVINAFRDYMSGTTTKGQLLGDLLKRGLVLVLAAIMLWTSVPHNWAAFNDWRISLQQEQMPDGDDDPPPAGDDTGGDLSDYKIDMDEADLAKWLDEFNPNWRVEMLNNWDDSSMPSNAEARNKAVHDAGGKFEYCVSTPMQDLKILLDGSYTGDTLAAIKKGIQKKLILDPIYADGFVQACRLMAPEILELNPWLAEYADWLDEVFHRTDSTQKGINALTNDLCSALTPYVFYNNVRLAVLFGQFTATGVEALESSHNWHLPIVAKASDTRLVESPEQESSAAVIFVARYKLADGTEGACAIKLGINVWDKRIELFDPKAPVTPPATQTPPDENPPGTGNPGTTPPDPKTYSISVIGYEYGTNKSVVVLEKYTAFSGLADGTSKLIDAPPVAGYTPHKGYEQLTVTISGSNATAEFYYDKTQTKKDPTYTVTAIGYEYGTNKSVVVLEEYTVKTKVKDGTTVPVDYKKVDGYTIHPGYERVTVTVNGNNVRAEFFYDANKFPLYYQRGYFALYTGRWTVIDQQPIYVGDYAKNERYSFNVTAPAAPDNDTRYLLRDGSPVTGNMPGEKTTLRVVCLVQHRLDISYKKVTDTGSVKAFDPHRDWITEGDGFYVVAPPLTGYYASPDPVSGTMGTGPYYTTVFYYKNGQKPDGGGAKLPETDPVNTERDDGSGKSNAEVGGGKNQTTDGTGEFQQTEPGRTDYPEQGTQTTTTTGGTTTSGSGTTTTTTTTTTTVTGGDKGTSGETGTIKQDSNVTADDGGTTHGGTSPGNDPITVDPGTTVTTTTENSNGTTTTTTENTAGQTFDGQYGGGEPT